MIETILESIKVVIFIYAAYEVRKGVAFLREMRDSQINCDKFEGPETQASRRHPK